jgi:hypothetical protein
MRILWLPIAFVVLGPELGCQRSPDTGSSSSGGSTAAASEPSKATPAPPSAMPNALAMPPENIEAVVNPNHIVRYEGPTASVEGTVYVSGPDAPDLPQLDVKSCPAALDTYGKLFRAGPPEASGRRPVADAVVVVTAYAEFIPAKSDAVRVTIGANCAYPTRTITMTFGQRLEVVNESKIAFAPTLTGSGPRAVFMVAPPSAAGDPVKLYPQRPGHFLLGDAIQPFVREAVLVLRQPLHAVTDLAGHYRIDGIPTGKLKVGTQLEAIGAESQRDIDVHANVVEKVDFVLSYSPGSPAPPGAPPPGVRIIP